MLKHLGEVKVRGEQNGKYVVKVMIVDYPDRTESNLLIDKNQLKEMGINTLKQAQKELPNMKSFLLEEINRTFPTYWDVED